mmetsp:Transcript_27247/g.70165  ORF Transcript_27247/g.70165 Transcript_27247/m.70165 type:complete len:216 (-) Transcript_27247:732-1379(-)
MRGRRRIRGTTTNGCGTRDVGVRRGEVGGETSVFLVRTGVSSSSRNPSTLFWSVCGGQRKDARGCSPTLSKGKEADVPTTVPGSPVRELPSRDGTSVSVELPFFCQFVRAALVLGGPTCIARWFFVSSFSFSCLGFLSCVRFSFMRSSTKEESRGRDTGFEEANDAHRGAEGQRAAHCCTTQTTGFQLYICLCVHLRLCLVVFGESVFLQSFRTH